MTEQEILARLRASSEPAYAALQREGIPTVAPETIIGVRTPILRALAKEIAGQSDTADFLRALPHFYFEENQLHAFILGEEKDFDRCLRAVDAFLPYVDNWATCDQMSPKCFKKNRAALLEAIRRWMDSDRPYTVRFAVGMLKQYFLDEDFDAVFLRWAAEVRSEEYYVNMMVAWYFATALAKQYDAALPYLQDRRLPAWTHNKAIQKAVESRRVSDEKKAYLKTLRVKGKH